VGVFERARHWTADVGIWGLRAESHRTSSIAAKRRLLTANFERRREIKQENNQNPRGDKKVVTSRKKELSGLSRRGGIKNSQNGI